MLKTYSELVQFINAAKEFTGNDKFSYAVQKVAKRIVAATKDINESYSESLRDKRIDAASVDKDNNLIIKEDDYVFTKAELKKLLPAIKKLTDERNAQTFEIENYIVPAPADLTFEQREAFSELVIEKIKEE